MFIELAEFLRCPHDSTEAYCVVAPEEMVGRQILRGTIGCPATGREYRIENGVADFAPDAPAAVTYPDVLMADAPSVHALLGVTTPGGYIVLIGSAARLASDLARRLEGVHFVGLNAPPDLPPTPTLSLLRGPHPLPLRSSMARGVVIGAEFATEPWVSEAVRLLLRGLRLVAFCEEVVVPNTRTLAAESGLWVGQRSA